MAQECGAAQPLCDIPKKLFGQKETEKKSPPKDDDRLKAANESFRVSNSQKPVTQTGKAAPKTKRRKAHAYKR